MKTDGELYLATVRRLPCIVAGASCRGRVHAHHAGERPGMGRKAADDTAVPLCMKHHADWHGATGWFKGIDRDGRREWAAAAIAATRQRLTPF